MKIVTLADDLLRLRGQALGRKWLYRPDAKALVILFTPRSGSTWFGSILRGYNVFGFPEEYINQECVPDANNDLDAASEYDFLCGCLASRTTPNGFFSIEVTWGDIERLETVDFFEFFKGAFFVWLRRFDLIDQAISLLAATESGNFHRTIGSDDHRKDNSLLVVVSSLEKYKLHQKLLEWMAHIIHYEVSTELQLVCRSIDVYRLFYEDIVRDPFSHIHKLARLCSLDLPDRQQIGDITKNDPSMRDEIRLEFIKSNSVSINALQRARPPLLY